jgi:hypothetical protein
MRRTIAILVVTLALLLAFAAPAAAHNLEVDPPGKADVIHGWAGALGLPGSGRGLIPGGPDGTWLLAPAHANGLVTACEATEANPSVVDIRGPGGPGCPHGE